MKIIFLAQLGIREYEEVGALATAATECAFINNDVYSVCCMFDNRKLSQAQA